METTTRAQHKAPLHIELAHERKINAALVKALENLMRLYEYEYEQDCKNIGAKEAGESIWDAADAAIAQARGDA